MVKCAVSQIACACRMRSHKTSLNIPNQVSLQPQISFKNRTLKQASQRCLRNAVQTCHRIFPPSLTLSLLFYCFFPVHA
jgi:hypothetical protein